MKRILLAAFILMINASQISASDIISYTQEDKEIYDNYVKWIDQHKSDPVEGLMVKTAKFFMEKPYKDATLEINTTEQLVINLREFDCTTFIETCMALTKTVESGDTSFENFANTLKSIRYRDGVIDGYSSRLHYMIDWIHNNEKNGFVKNISAELAGEVKNKKINFMSSNSGRYKQLKNNTEEKKKIEEIEKTINSRKDYIVIPTYQMARHEWRIKDGDLVLFVTDRGGLDYHHIGIICHTLEGVRFIHASSKYKEVTIEEKTIHEYVYRSRSGNAISIVRIL